MLTTQSRRRSSANGLLCLLCAGDAENAKQPRFPVNCILFEPTVCRKGNEKSPQNTKKPQQNHFYCGFCGATGNRTRDTRIFSPLLYQLSYGTIICLELPYLSIGIAKVGIFSKPANFSCIFFKKIEQIAFFGEEICIFAKIWMEEDIYM